VARLYSDGVFEDRLKHQFAEPIRLTVHLAPPLLSRRDPSTGEPRKMEFGPWMFSAFRLLARFKRLRGTPFDVFGYTAERRAERRLVRDYEADVERLLAGLRADNLDAAVAIAELPDRVRGFGHIKARSLEEARTLAPTLWSRFERPGPRRVEDAA